MVVLCLLAYIPPAAQARDTKMQDNIIATSPLITTILECTSNVTGIAAN